MIPEDLLITVFTIDLSLAIIGIQIWNRMVRKDRRSDLMTQKLYEATSRFSKSKRELQEKYLILRDQLEKAEAAWGDLQLQLQYKDQELRRFLVVFKRLETNHQDMTVKYNNLVGQYNFLTSKKPDDEMPV